jgi:hypothetical protein
MKLQTILEDYRAAVVALQGEIKTVRTQAGEQEKALRYLCCDMTNQVCYIRTCDDMYMISYICESHLCISWRLDWLQVLLLVVSMRTNTV